MSSVFLYFLFFFMLNNPRHIKLYRFVKKCFQKFFNFNKKNNPYKGVSSFLYGYFQALSQSSHCRFPFINGEATKTKNPITIHPIPTGGIISSHMPRLIIHIPTSAKKQPPRDFTLLDPHLGQGSHFSSLAFLSTPFSFFFIFHEKKEKSCKK